MTKAAHTDDARALSVGVASHINAAAPGGPRYDPTQTPEERRAITNGIWLCATCATLIDKDPRRFPAELLRRWKASAEDHATQRLAKGAIHPARTALDRMKAVPSQSVARLSYFPLNRETAHELEVSVVGVDETANVLRFTAPIGPHPESLFEVPLRDVEEVWCAGGIHHVRLAGYLEHEPLRPYRYVSRLGRPQGNSDRTTPIVDPHLNADALEVMSLVAQRYVEAGFPNYKVWRLSFPLGDPNASELGALRLIERFGLHGLKDQEWRLTDLGQSWIMSHRSSPAPLSDGSPPTPSGATLVDSVSRARIAKFDATTFRSLADAIFQTAWPAARTTAAEEIARRVRDATSGGTVFNPHAILLRLEVIGDALLKTSLLVADRIAPAIANAPEEDRASLCKAVEAYLESEADRVLQGEANGLWRHVPQFLHGSIPDAQPAKTAQLLQLEAAVASRLREHRITADLRATPSGPD